jgi:hypothetical protein
MITREQCKTYLLECEELGAQLPISARLATAIMALNLNLNVLARSVAKYESAVRDEAKRGEGALAEILER